VRNIKILQFFFLLSLMPIGAWAQLASITPSETTSQTVEATGFGGSFEEALSQALILAVGTVNGTRIPVKQERKIQTQVSSNAFRLRAKIGTFVLNADYGNAPNRSESKPSFTLQMPGDISGFKVISANSNTPDTNGMSFEAPSSNWVVKISATVSKNATYRPSAVSGRIKLGIMPLRYNSQKISTSTAEIVVHEWRTTIVKQLSKSGRVAIVDRTFEAEIDNELNFLVTKNIRLDQVARLHERVGADYILVGSIDTASIIRDIRTMKLSGKTIEGPAKVNLKVSYRLIETATGVIEVAEDYTKYGVPSAGLKSLTRRASIDASKKLLTRLFPLRVEKISGSTAYLGAGEETLKPNQKLSVFQMGLPITDSYTGEVIGREETSIGTITVREVQPRMTIADFDKAPTYNKAITDKTVFLARILSVSTNIKPTVNTAPYKPKQKKPIPASKPKTVDDIREKYEGRY